MDDVTDDELLRLARKAWPNEDPSRFAMWGDGSPLMAYGRFGTAITIPKTHPRARQALLAALKVLAGEE